MTVLLVFLTIPWAGAAAAAAPVNLAPKAKVWASSEYSDTWAARFAIDSKVPQGGRGNDAGKAWAINRAKAGDKAEFTLQWPQPVDIATVVYWGRTGSLLSECWKDYELYLDDAAKPAAKGTFRMVREPQRIDIDTRPVTKLRLKFLNSYGPWNPGASQIAVYSRKPPQVQLDWFPLSGKELEERIALEKKERANLTKVAATIPGKVVFLKGTRPWNHLDWQTPMISGGSYATVENHTHRCYIEKDTPGPANAGNQLYVLDPAQPDLKPEVLVDAGTGWIGCALSASYDGETLYFCMAPEDDPFFHIYSIPTSGGEARQLTAGTFQDCDPDILPDGRLVFCSTRFGSREEYHSHRVSTLFTMTGEGQDIRPLTYHVVNDREPKVTARGDIVFVRQDNFFMNAKIATQIFHIDVNGRGQFMLLGPDRGGSGYNRYTMHDSYPQALGLLAPRRLMHKRTGHAFGNPTPLPGGRTAALCGMTDRGVTANHPFKEHGIGIVVSSSAASSIDGFPVSTSKPLHDISALPDGRLLCSTLDRKSLGIVDLGTGVVTPFYMSRSEDIQAPLFVGPRRKPLNRAAPAPVRDTGRLTGRFYCQNVFETKQVRADLKRIKAVRVFEGRPLTTRMLTATPYHGGVNHIGTEAVELGVVPLCPDGSFFVEVPADRALAFQAIDGEGRAVINEFTWIYVRPKETRSCLGCHSGRDQSPTPDRGMALDAPPPRLTGEGIPFRYKANSVTYGIGGGVLGSQMDRIRETKSINFYPYPHPRSDRNAPPLAPGRAATTEALIALLQEGTDGEKVSAAQHLGTLRSRAAVPALVAATRDARAAVRMNAAVALASCGDRQAVDALRKGILDADVQVALASTMAISHLTGHDQGLKGVGKGDFRECADRWRQWLANNDWSQVETRQIERLKSRDPQVAIMAVQSLGHIGGPAARDALRAYAKRCLDLNDATDTRSLVDAMLSLGYLGDADAVALLDGVLRTHIPLPKGERSVKLAEAAAESLGWIGSAEAEKALIERSRGLLVFSRYNLALGDQGGGWGDYLGCSSVHYRFLEAFDAMGSKLPEPTVWAFVLSLHLNYDQPLLPERDTYETMLARVVQRSGCLEPIIDTCFAMIGVGNGPLNDDFKKVLVAQVTSQRYAQMHGTHVTFTLPQRVAYILSVLGIRPQDAPRYQEAFEKYRERYFEIRKDVRGLETGACAWICYHSLETLGRLEDVARYELFLGALKDPPEAVD
ncbi:HEAT repeat domain-containing protein, partial [Planctomycetota bacterium]